MTEANTSASPGLEPPTITLHARLPAWLYNAVKDGALARGRTTSAHAGELLAAALTNPEPRPSDTIRAAEYELALRIILSLHTIESHIVAQQALRVE